MGKGGSSQVTEARPGRGGLGAEGMVGGGRNIRSSSCSTDAEGLRMEGEHTYATSPVQQVAEENFPPLRATECWAQMERVLGTGGRASSGTIRVPTQPPETSPRQAGLKPHDASAVSYLPNLFFLSTNFLF